MPTLPNLLTLLRVAAVPVLVAALLADAPAARWAALAVFAAAAATDFLDGWLARREGLATDFGRFLDPVADKLLVASALMMLAALGHVGGAAVIPAVIILCREILVSGLREYLAGIDVGLPVSRLAKWKTALQMAAIGLLIVGDAAHPPVPAEIPVRLVGEAGLWTAAAVTLATGFGYLRVGLRHMAGPAGDGSR